MLGLLVVVAPALEVALAAAVVAVVLAPVALQGWHSCLSCLAPGAARPARELKVCGSSCSATLLLLQVNSH